MLGLGPGITWIKVEKPTFDLLGLVLGSFRLAGALLLVALVLGVALGCFLILSRRRGGGRAPPPRAAAPRPWTTSPSTSTPDSRLASSALTVLTRRVRLQTWAATTRAGRPA
jgi:hypothetical protein